MQTTNNPLLRTMACNRTAPDSPHTHVQDCADTLNISIFFDGTGNNSNFDEKSKKWSNVERIYRSTLQRSINEKANLNIHTNYPIYISGVGTPFNGTAASFATPAIQTMFASYVHDSKAGFLMGAEPFSYFRQRGVTESSINILARGLRWFDEVAKDVSQNVIRVYYSAEKVVVERWTQGKKDIQRTYAVGEKFIITTGKTYALEIIDSTSKMATKTFDAGEKMVLSAVNETKSLALEVEQTGERIVVNVTKYVEDGWQKMKEAF